MKSHSISYKRVVKFHIKLKVCYELELYRFIHRTKETHTQTKPEQQKDTFLQEPFI